MSVRPKMKELSLEERKAGFDEVEKGGLPATKRFRKLQDAFSVTKRRASPDVLPELMWLVSYVASKQETL